MIILKLRKAGNPLLAQTEADFQRNNPTREIIRIDIGENMSLLGELELSVQHEFAGDDARFCFCTCPFEKDRVEQGVTQRSTVLGEITFLE